MSKKKARLHLQLAKKQLDRVQIASFDPQDPEEAVTWAFYAYENAIVATAEAKGIAWEKKHPFKVVLAGELHTKGILSLDAGPTIERLNELRKDVQYGEPGPELEDENLEDLATDLENLIDEVEAIVGQL